MIKKIKKTLIFSALSFSVANSYEVCGIDKVGCSLISISPAIGYYKYEEPKIHTPQGQKYMNIKGVSFRLDGAYQYIDRNRVTLIVDGELAFVNGKYDGFLQNGEPFQMSNDDSYILGVSPKIGYVFSWQGVGVNLTPFVGLGYRFLDNDTSGTSGGYKRISNYFYIPIGVDFDWRKNKFMLQSRVEFDGLIQGVQYSSVDGGVTNDQREGWGANAYVLLGRDQGGWAWLVGPYVKYWKMQTSETSTGNTGNWVEPENNTLESGVQFKFIF
ncbi:hypothetical protein [Caedibacter taeniospiralis]|uniref:hypothetical protein n=1 Tax=Caedibacter taeniospiralis TaxID=28907 RepID=UPI000C26E2FC|nr:hypothetical protein [Caedibacter taeniospiralis]